MAQQARDFVEPASGGQHPGSVRSLWIAGRPFPVRNAAYLGSLKSQLLIPVLALAGSSDFVVRATTLCTALLALLLGMLWTHRVFGATVALLGGLLVASDPSFFFLSQFEWGPFTTNLLCRTSGLLLLTAAIQSQRPARAHTAAGFGGLALGLGIFSRADFALIVAAFGVALLVCHAKHVAEFLRERTSLVAVGTAALLLGAAPMIASALQLLSTGSEIADRGGLLYKGRVLWTVLDGSHFHRLMQVGGLFDEIFDLDAPSGLFGWVLLASAVMLGLDLIRRRRGGDVSRESDPRHFLLIGSALLCLGMLLMPGAVRAHHQLNSLPFLHWMVALAALAAWHYPLPNIGARRVVRATTVLVLAAVVIGNLATIAATQRLIQETGGRGRWTREIHHLADRINQRPGGRVVSLDWGFHEPLLFLTRGAQLVEPIWTIPATLQQGRAWSIEGDADTLYLVHGAPYDLFGLGERFLADMRGLGFGETRIETHHDRSGSVAFYSVRIPRPHRLVFDGHFRLR